ncbi:hypothetical protein ALP16_200157 [Pseudomonas savastanoi]|uniref:Uncharacterized protein n=1 Tax=Pseudomonas savastanoi TaxID=29438 RepID=A0A3M6AMI5_PSESS|nr:hypothetical protein ALO74_200127 [Pseudomonas syringae pv. cunninghamiae]RMV20509.1 hypothetical protein ALP16_200157 [Pseudomonas savastanoi]
MLCVSRKAVFRMGNDPSDVDQKWLKTNLSSRILDQRHEVQSEGSDIQKLFLGLFSLSEPRQGDINFLKDRPCLSQLLRLDKDDDNREGFFRANYQMVVTQDVSKCLLRPAKGDQRMSNQGRGLRKKRVVAKAQPLRKKQKADEIDCGTQASRGGEGVVNVPQENVRFGFQ